MTEKQLQAIQKHGEKLLRLFPLATERDPVALCRKLRRLESRGQAFALRLCNGPEYPGGYEEADKVGGKILDAADRLLHYTESKVPLFLNRDPRGYALKICDNYMSKHTDCPIERDWGGYGIVAPEIK